jgi:hypothetical protein
VIVMLALASLGGGYQTLGEAADAKAYPMPGQLIDVGGHRLHLNCTGAGTPTVVLEPAAGGMSSNLGWIAPAVARATRVTLLRGGDPAIDTAAASSNDRFAGFNDRTSTGTETYSAKPPYPCSRRLA